MTPARNSSGAPATRRSPLSTASVLRFATCVASKGQLDHAQTGRGESRTPRRRAVPARRLHRDESPAPESRRRAVLQQARHRGTVNQRGQAGGTWDVTIVSSVPGERGPAPVERAGVQPRELVAATRAAGANRGLVAHQSPAAHRQDGWAAGQARPVLLVDVGRESSDAAAVRGDAPADLGAPGAGGLAERWATTPGERDRVRAIAASAVVPLPVAPGAITGGVDERQVLPSHDCRVCDIEQPLKSGSDTAPRDWATRRRQLWDSKMEIPAERDTRMASVTRAHSRRGKG
jgi:hypothetical protein